AWSTKGGSSPRPGSPRESTWPSTSSSAGSAARSRTRRLGTSNIGGWRRAELLRASRSARKDFEPGEDGGDHPVAAFQPELEGPRQQLSGAGGEIAAEVGAGAVEADLDDALAHSQGVGDFQRGAALDLAQQEDRATDRREVADRGFENSAELAVERLLLGPPGGFGFAIHGLPFEVDFVEPVGRPAAIAPGAGERLVHRDPRQPGREAGSEGELAEVGEGADPGLLRHVLGLRVVTYDRAG